MTFSQSVGENSAHEEEEEEKWDEEKKKKLTLSTGQNKAQNLSVAVLLLNYSLNILLFLVLGHKLFETPVQKAEHLIHHFCFGSCFFFF